MKKIFSLLMVIVMLICVGCSSENTDDSDIKTYEPNFFIDFIRYTSAEEIVNDSTHIFEGRVIDIDFAVINKSTGKIQTTPVDPQEADNYHLHTVYKIAVIRTYKGKTNYIESVAIIGGMEDQLKAEQKKALEEVGLYDPEKGIMLVRTASKYVECHKTYLFCVRDVGLEYKGGIPQQFALEEGSKRAQRNPAEDPNEVKKYLPYVPHPLLIVGGIAVAATAVVLVVVIWKKRKKTATVSQPQEPTDEQVM